MNIACQPERSRSIDKRLRLRSARQIKRKIMSTLQKQTDLQERIRMVVLNLGYDLIKFRSKAKKAFTIFKRQLTPTLLNS